MQKDNSTHDSVQGETSTYSKEMQAVLGTSELARYCLEWLRDREQYNGWTNYATWRINLELVNADEYSDTVYKDTHELSETIKDAVYEYIESEGNDSEGINFAVEYANAFIDDVNWYEIASHIADDYPSIIASDSDDE